MVYIFHINIGDVFETFDVGFEIYIEDKLVQRQQMEAPKEMLMMNFIRTAKQLSADKRPIMMKMIRQETIWDNFENQQKVLNNEVEFKNNARIAWENDNEVTE